MKFVNKLLFLVLLSFCTSLFAQADTTITNHWRLIWDKNDTSDHVIDYTIYRDEHAGASLKIATILHDTSSLIQTMEYVDSLLDPGVHYHYRIKARNMVGQSVYSEEVDAAIPGIDLSPVYRLGTDRIIELNLNENITYINGEENSLQWKINPDPHDSLDWTIINNIATITFPDDWWGTQTLRFKATSPDAFFSTALVLFICDTSSNNQRVYDVQSDTSTIGQVIIDWKTDLSSQDRIRYGETTSYGDSTDLTPLSTSHERILTGLKSNTIYHFVIVSEYGGNDPYISSDYTFTTKSMLPPNVGDKVNVYPIPLRLSEPGTPEQITFNDLPVGSEIIIYTMLGDPVFKIKDLNDGQYIWDIKNNAGQSVRSGLYLYVVKSPGGKQEGKIIIIR